MTARDPYAAALTITGSIADGTIDDLVERDDITPDDVVTALVDCWVTLGAFLVDRMIPVMIELDAGGPLSWPRPAPPHTLS